MNKKFLSLNHVGTRSGFMLLEALATCAVVMLTWYVIVQCALQALVFEHTLEKNIAALIAVSTTIEKLRAGVYPLRNQTITFGTLSVIVTCQQKFYDGLVQRVTIQALEDTQELLCITTALLKK